MKILSAAQIHAWDAHTTHVQNISSPDLMERAANAVTDWLMQHYTVERSFIVVCGTGNNGGDGLAVARLLHGYGYGVQALLLEHGHGLSADCGVMLQRAQAADKDLVLMLQPGALITELARDVIVIDALLGTGLNRPAEGWLADFIRHINKLPNERISIDMPSGMAADSAMPKDAAIVKAAHTLTFQTMKRALLHAENGGNAGRITVLDIGLDARFSLTADSEYYTLETSIAQSLYRPRTDFGNKGTYGTAMLIGGSYGMVGAALLCTEAAGRAGAGKVITLTAECGYGIIQTAVPDALCRTAGSRHIDAIEDYDTAKGIGIGPGLGHAPETATALEKFLENYRQPLVIDADALNMIAEKKWLDKIPAGAVLTPHPKEFERLFGKTADSFARVEAARGAAQRYGIYLVVKDHHSIIATPEGHCFYNLNGNAGMATGGSGDVLTGIITALLAQGYPAHDAALLGVWLHGAAGDAAQKARGTESMIASDIVAHLGDAFAQLNK